LVADCPRTGQRQGNTMIEPLLKLLNDPSIDARLGAHEVLAAFKQQAAPAVPKLRATLKSDDLWLRVKATEALSAIGVPAKVAVPEMLRMAAKCSMDRFKWRDSTCSVVIMSARGSS
jgi:hypothetical protein